MVLTREQILQRLRENPNTLSKLQGQDNEALFVEHYNALKESLRKPFIKFQQAQKAIWESTKYNLNPFNEAFAEFNKTIPLRIILSLLQNLQAGYSEEVDSCLRFFGIKPQRGSRINQYDPWFIHEAAWTVIRQKTWRDIENPRIHFHTAVLDKAKKLHARYQKEKPKPNLHIFLDDGSHKLAIPETEEQQLRFQELFAALDKTVTKRQQQIIKMVWGEGLTIEEASNKAGISTDNIYVQIHLLRKKIKKIKNKF